MPQKNLVRLAALAVLAHSIFALLTFQDTQAAEASSTDSTSFFLGVNPVDKIQKDLNRTKDAAAALKALEDLLAKEPNNVSAHMLLGKVLTYLGYEKLADEQFQIADKLDPSQPDSVLSLFRSRLQTYGPKAAYEYLRYVQNRFPNDPSVLIMQGLLERMKGNNVKAEYFYRLAIKNNQNTPGLSTALASLRLAQRRYKKAIEFADADLKTNKDHAVANLAKGQALLLDGHADRAIPFLSRALKSTNTNDSFIADLLSRAYISNGQYSEALEPTLLMLVYSDLKDAEATKNVKRRLQMILKKDPFARSEVLNVMEIVQKRISNPDKSAYAYLALGDILDLVGAKKEALVAFTRGLENKPGVGRAYLRIGIIKEEEGDSRSASQYYEMAYRYSPKDRETAARLYRIANRSNAKLKLDLAFQLKKRLRALSSGSQVASDPASSLQLP